MTEQYNEVCTAYLQSIITIITQSICNNSDKRPKPEQNGQKFVNQRVAN